MSEKINERQFTCIICPLGCAVTVKSDNAGNITEIIGNKCHKGEEYIREEFSAPMRILTSTVTVDASGMERVPVRTSGMIPKTRIFDAMKEIRKIRIKSLVKSGDVIIKDILGLGVDVVATRDAV